jgi:hypothetical protein
MEHGPSARKYGEMETVAGSTTVTGLGGGMHVWPADWELVALWHSLETQVLRFFFFLNEPYIIMHD